MVYIYNLSSGMAETGGSLGSQASRLGYLSNLRVWLDTASKKYVDHTYTAATHEIVF